VRIISNFHDYYDSVQKYGQDKSIVYLRKNQELDLQEVKRSFPGKYDELFNMKFHEWSRCGELNRTYFKLLFFCGVIYPIVELEMYRYDQPYPYTLFRIFKFEDLEQIMRDEFEEKVLQRYLQNGWLTDFCEENMKKFYSLKNCDLNVDLKCPIILLSANDNKNRELKLNPSLKDIEFYREVETGLAFQKIESFIGGVMTASPVSMVKVSDKTRLEKRGFDSKLSFRKGKET
jgi:hypothetical protein